MYHFRRTATKDLEFGWFASGNRDSAVFDDPHKFDVTRNPNEHMTFGRGGPHMCLGDAHARLEIKVMFEDLVHRIDSMERAGPTWHLSSNFVNGIKEFPVKVNPR